jgi:hypothetical protein
MSQDIDATHQISRQWRIRHPSVASSHENPPPTCLQDAIMTLMRGIHTSSKRWSLIMSVGALAFTLLSGFLSIVGVPASLRWSVIGVCVLWIAATAAMSVWAHRKEQQQDP